MLKYLINQDQIETCSEHGIVCCWSDDHDSAVTDINEKTDLLFPDNEKVEVMEDWQPN